MPDDRRINIRVSPDLYDRLDDKRHKLRTSFQQLGTGLFIKWLDGDIEPAPVAEDPAVTVFRKFLEEGAEEKVRLLRGLLEMFWSNHERNSLPRS